MSKRPSDDCWGAAPAKAAKLRVLDPACGSGSFLLGAYEYLLDWYRNWYVEDGPEKHKKELVERPGGWRLTLAEKRRILVNNIYGVDIDPQAVEVTKLSLLLKVLEGEVSTGWVAKERALPDLDRNILCGNSLVGPDFYDAAGPVDAETRLRVNAFDWKAAFPAATKAGGFDAVIGNPPYGADYDQVQKSYFQSIYIYREGKPETYIYFLDRAMRLLKQAGILGFIIPNAWLTNHYGSQIRRHVLANTAIDCVVDLEPTKVFVGATVDTTIITLTNGPSRPSAHLTQVARGTPDRRIVESFTIRQQVWAEHDEAVINLHATPVELALIQQIERAGRPLGEVVEFSQGAIPYETKAQGEANLYIAEQPRGADWLPLLESAAQVRRYEIDPPTAFIHYGPWLCRPREQRFFSEPKILFHRLRKKLPRQLVGVIEESGAINRHALSNLILRPGLPRATLSAVLALFNSNLANWWFIKSYGLLMEVGEFKVSRLPMPARWNAGHDRLAALAAQMLALHAELARARVPHERAALEAQIAATDRQIDRLVYDLYGLTDDDIRVVEGTPAAPADAD